MPDVYQCLISSFSIAGKSTFRSTGLKECFAIGICVIVAETRHKFNEYLRVNIVYKFVTTRVRICPEQEALLANRGEVVL